MTVIVGEFVGQWTCWQEGYNRDIKRFEQKEAIWRIETGWAACWAPIVRKDSFFLYWYKK